MKELQKYVDDLFRHQNLTPEIKDLKEEVLSNMTAKRDDLIARGFGESDATEKVKESLSSIDHLIDGNQLTDAGKYHTECSQTVLLNCIIFWIFSFPLLFFGHYAIFSYMGLLLTIVSGAVYLLKNKRQSDVVAFLSISESERRRKIVWIVWTLFFTVWIGTMAAVTFGSNLWFQRPLHIDGPYQAANIAIRFYLPLITMIVPITFSNFTKLLTKGSMKMNRKNIIILCLLAVAVILFGMIQFWIIPADNAKQEEYAHNQTDALTHDISAVQNYKSPYIGDASNTINLFGVLPLNNLSKKFEIDSDACSLTVNYSDSIGGVAEEKLKRNLIYTSIAAMAAVDNLAKITYNFPDSSYSFGREQVEEVFGTPLSDLLDKEAWSKQVQENLSSADFVGQFFD